MAARLPSTHPRQKHVPNQTLVQARDETQSHSRQTQHSQQPQYTTWTDQELIFEEASHKKM